MNKFVFLSFVFMGWAFFELSGGTDFVPRKAELMAAAEAARAQEAESRNLRVAVRSAPSDPVAIDPTLTRVSLRPVEEPQAEPEPLARPSARGANEAAPSVFQAAVESPPQTTLISLEQSGDLFARPLAQLEEEGLASTSAEPTPASDIREVAGTRVNMRNGPGTGFGVLTSLPRGTAVEVIGNDGTGWVKLRTVEDQAVGWMAERLLTPPTS